MLNLLLETMYNGGSRAATALGSGLAGIVKGYTSGHGDSITPQLIDNLVTYGPVATGAAIGGTCGVTLGCALGGASDGLKLGAYIAAAYAGIAVLSQAAGFGIGYAASKIL